MSENTVLKIQDLRTYFFSRSKQVFIRSVDGVDLQVNRGETLGIVGESGSGKSVTALSVTGLVTAEPGVITGTIEFTSNGVTKNLLQGLEDFVTFETVDGRIMTLEKDNRGWQKNVDRLVHRIRGQEISMIFQNPRVSMNPFMTIGKQITESIMLNTAIKNAAEATDKARYWLEQVKIDSPNLRLENFPYGLSGGMCQRAMIAMALSSEPSLLIADEPTTGLDSTIQSKIVDLLVELKEQVGVTTMLISHDINIISRLADNVAVMYGGSVMESGPVERILAKDDEYKHPYTAALLESIPDEEHIKLKGHLKAIEGDVLDTVNIPDGCRFYSRCNRVHARIEDKCRHTEPELRELSEGRRIRCWLYLN